MDVFGFAGGKLKMAVPLLKKAIVKKRVKRSQNDRKIRSTGQGIHLLHPYDYYLLLPICNSSISLLSENDDCDRRPSLICIQEMQGGE